MENWQQQAIVDVFQNYQGMLMNISILLITGALILLTTKKYKIIWKIVGSLGVVSGVLGIIINHHIYSVSIERLKRTLDIKGSYLLEVMPNQCLGLTDWFVFQIICNIFAALFIVILLIFGREKA